ncbi:MAG: hypothetical protein ACR2IT_03075 [Pirellulales bacterium]
MALTDEEIAEIDRLVQRCGAANCWTGTMGSLAAGARRLVKHIREGQMPADETTAWPHDHILRGDAELKRYLGDEQEEACDTAGVVLPRHDAPTHRPGTDRFLAVLEEIGTLHVRKSLDYGVDEDALANIRAGAEAIGVEPWKGCLLRISDKMQRLRAFCRRGACEFDGVEDTLLDIAAYAAIALVTYRESRPSAPPAAR